MKLRAWAGNKDATEGTCSRGDSDVVYWWRFSVVDGTWHVDVWPDEPMLGGDASWSYSGSVGDDMVPWDYVSYALGRWVSDA